jgi:transposase
VNKKRSCLKILYWDKTGFALWMKRLEEAKFPWPRKFEEEVVSMTGEQLTWLLEGYEFWKMRPHQELKYACVS